MADIGLGLDYNPLNENFARTGGSLFSTGDPLTDLSSSYGQAESHDDAMVDLQKAAMRQSLSMQQAAQAFRKNMANEQLQQFRRSTQDARRVAAQQLSGLTTALPQAMAGWNENFLTQLNTSALATGAVQQAAGHLGAIQEAVSLGGVKDLATLLGE